jgi:uncharacterized protein (TIGR03067 family)
MFAEIGAKEKTKGERKETELVIEGSKFTIVEGDRKEVVHFTLDPNAKPHPIDFYRNSDKKEKVWHGIYAFDGKDLKLCWGPAGPETPQRRWGQEERPQPLLDRQKEVSLQPGELRRAISVADSQTEPASAGGYGAASDAELSRISSGG